MTRINGSRRALAIILTIAIMVSVLSIARIGVNAAGDDWLWPVETSMRMSRGYYNRTLFYDSNGEPYYDTHQAIDITPGSESSTPVLASRAGRVITVFSGCKNWDGAKTGEGCDVVGCPNTNYLTYNGNKFCNYGVGQGVVIEHNDGYVSLYGHMESVSVSVGQTIVKGQQLGYMGSRGASTGKHLHFEIRNGYSSGKSFWSCAPVNNNPIGDEYICKGYWNHDDRILYSRDYSVYSTIKLTLDPNGGTGGTREVYFKKGVNKFYSDSACTNEITKITAPTREGFTFLHYYGDGSSGGENGERYIYGASTSSEYYGKFAGDLCTDIYKDATLYAKWKENTYYLDVNAFLDGEEVNTGTDGYGTFDVYINGELVRDDVTDYYVKLPVGTRYENKDIKATECHTYEGTHYGSLSGTIGEETASVSLSFVTSHNWGRCVSLSDTKHQRVCANDPSHVEISDHNWVMITKPATCTTPAVREFVCGECGASYTVTDGEWSEWREGEGFGFEGAEEETKTQYRYSTRTTVSSEWQQSGTGTIDHAVSWPSGFDTSSSIYSQYNKNAAGYENSSQKRVINSDSKIGYIYWHWCRGTTQSGGPKNRIVYPYKTGDYSTFHAFYSTEDYEYRTFSNDDPAYVSSQPAVCGDSFYWVDTRVTINRATYTDYTKVDIYEWSDYSEWQDTPVEANDNTVVETRQVFRFKYPAEYGEHKWDSGTITVAPTATTPGIITYTCTICGETRMEIVPALGDRIKGDMDGDGEITVADALSALRIAARLAPETPEMIAVCDTDGDGAITVADALAILRVAAKLADSL